MELIKYQFNKLIGNPSGIFEEFSIELNKYIIILNLKDFFFGNVSNIFGNSSEIRMYTDIVDVFMYIVYIYIFDMFFFVFGNPNHEVFGNPSEIYRKSFKKSG